MKTRDELTWQEAKGMQIMSRGVLAEMLDLALEHGDITSKLCDRYINKSQCQNEATWRFKHEFGTIVHRCDEHMEDEYKMVATISI